MKKFGIAVKAFIADEKGRLLIIRRHPKDVHAAIWEIPGGRLELAEDPHSGLKREVKEEAGIDIEIIRPLNVQHFTREDGQVITMLIFLCKPLSKAVKLSAEHTAYDWMDLNGDTSKLSKFFEEEVKIYKKDFRK